MKWFISQNDRIHGPYDQVQVPDILRGLGAKINSTFLWTRGLSDWVTADKWSPNQAKGATAFNSEITNTRPVPRGEVTRLDAVVQKPMPVEIKPQPRGSHLYKVQYNFIDQPLMTREELIDFTLKQVDISKIAVFDPKTKDWREIYAFPEIADKLGLSRRQNARVPILAQFVGQSSSQAKINSRVVTVSVGGFGLTDTFDLNIGETIRGQITSPHFFTPLSVEAEVTYMGGDGYIGLKFSQINDDTLALITEYVKKFSDK